jgi:hypothetical protein
LGGDLLASGGACKDAVGGPELLSNPNIPIFDRRLPLTTKHALFSPSFFRLEGDQVGDLLLARKKLEDYRKGNAPNARVGLVEGKAFSLAGRKEAL